MAEIVHFVTPPIEVICYTAGLIDGEGSITHSALYHKHGRTGVSVFQSFVNNGEHLCNWLRDQWGIGVVYMRQTRPSALVPKDHAPMFKWEVVRARETYHVLTAVKPYLIVKAEHAAIVIKLIGDALESTSSELRWTEAEDDYMRQNYGKQTAREIASYLKRSRPAIFERAMKLGIKAPKFYGGRLTESDVLAIRRLWAEGVNQREVGKRFGISKSTVSSIGLRKIWGHLEDSNEQ